MMNFVTKFHNLDGDLVHERKKSFSKLLKETSRSSIQFDIDIAIQNLHPKTYQEKLFWVETLIFFKKTVPLIELLKQGNREYVKMIVRQKWFIEDAFKDMSAEELVNDFFPCVSYSTRLKLLRRISNCWKEEKVDALFDATQKRYGFYIALSVLHVCSIPKIESLLKENEFALTAYQVNHIFNRNEEAFKIYLNLYNNLFKKPYNEQSIITMVASKNPILFLQLLNTDKISTEKLSKAASIKVGNKCINDILKNPKKFFEILNSRALAKILNSALKLFYERLFPTKFEDLNSKSDAVHLLKLFPKKTRWELLCETYKTNFPKKTIEELFTRLDSVILQLQLGKEIIRNWAEANYKGSNDETFLKYLPTSTSVPIIKEKINVTSDKEKRISLLQLLISSCAENKDMKTLDNVLEYIGSRHKNEDAYTYKKLIEFLCNTFTIEELTERHWKFIRQQTILLKCKCPLHSYEYRNIMEKTLEYSFKNDKELFKTVATEYIIESVDSNFSFRIHLQNIEIESKMFADFCNLFPIAVSSDHKHYVSSQSSLVKELYEISQKYPLNLREFPFLLSSIKAVINKKENLDYHEKRLLKSAILYHVGFPQNNIPFLNDSKVIELLMLLNSLDEENYGDLVRTIARKETITEDEYNILLHFVQQMNIDNVGSWIVDGIIESLLLLRPRLLNLNFEKIYSKLFIYCYIEEVKHYSHLGLDSKICEYIKKNWTREEHHQQEKAITILQTLLPEDEFIDFVDKNFNPDRPLEDIHNDRVSVRIQHYVEKLLPKGNEAQKFVPLVLKFCKGDYLEDALSALYSLVYRSPENKLQPYLEFLSKQDFSVRKHALFLSCELLDYNSIFSLLCAADLSTYGSHKHKCLATLKYFRKNCSEELFILLQKYLENIDNCDKVMFSTLTNTRVSKKYKAKYIVVCWKIIDKINEKIEFNKYLDELLEQMCEEDVLKDIPFIFAGKIIMQFLPIEGKNRLANINKFTIFLSHFFPDELFLLKVFKTLSELNKQSINNFCLTFVDFIYNKKPDAKYINLFLETWNKQFSLTDSLDQIIIFNCLLKYSKCSLKDYSKAIVDYLEQLIYELGPPVFGIFKNNFEKVFKKMNRVDQYNLLYFMLNYKLSPVVCVLIIQLITQVNHEENEHLKLVYDKIIQLLNKSNEPIVKSFYEIYLRNDNCLLSVK